MQLKIDNYTLGLILSNRWPELNWETFSSDNWGELIRKAKEEKVGSLLYWALSKNESYSNYPKSLKSSLRQPYINTWIHNQMLLNQLEILSNKYNHANIQVVVLKGICFALTIYPDLGLRPMADIDLLVPDSELPDAVQIAEELGFVDEIPEKSPGLRYLISREISMYKKENQYIKLDLHKGLVTESTSIVSSLDWFWNQTETLDCPGQRRYENTLMLTPTAQVLFAVEHAMLAHDGMGASLVSFYDLDRLIHFYDKRIDWDILHFQARLFEWDSALKVALAQTIAYFDTPIPPNVQESLAQYTNLPDKIIGKKPTVPDSPLLEKYRRLLSLKWKIRLIYIMALVIPTPAYMRWRYEINSTWQLPRYYLFRWWSILKDAFKTSLLILSKRN